MKIRLIGTNVIILAMVAGTANAEIIRYSQVGKTDAGMTTPDEWISFSGHVQNSAATITTAGTMGTSWNGAPDGTLTDDAINGLGTGLALTGTALTNGVAGPQFGSNNAGSLLRVKGGVSDNWIDSNESITFTFNQDVLLKEFKAQDDGNSNANGVLGTSARVNAAGVNYDFTLVNGGNLIDFGGVKLLKGQAITMSTLSVGDGWSVKALVVETIPEPETLGLIATFGGGILFFRRRLML